MKLLGKKINIFPNGQENILSFKSIKEIIDNNLLLKPPFQTDLDEDKVQEMVNILNTNTDSGHKYEIKKI